MNRRQKLRIITAISTLPLLAMFSTPAISSAAENTVNLGSASTFGVVGATGVTGVGKTTVDGTAGNGIGLAQGVSQFDSSTVTSASGDVHLADASVTQALVDLNALYKTLCSTTPTAILPSSNLATQVLSPGIYASSTGDFTNSGALTLNGQGNANSVFVFQAPKTLSTSSGSTITLVNGAQANNVYWCVGQTATLGASSTFTGELSALGNITANNGAKVTGQLASLAGGVSLNSNTINNSAFVAPVAPGTLIVIKKVVNTYGGTGVASDFMIHVTHNGYEVGGSPVAGNSATGTSYSLQPGTYLISEGDHAGYYGTFGSTDPTITSSVKDGLVDVVSGQTVTVIRTNYQIAPAYVPTPGPVASPIPGSPGTTTTSGTPVTSTTSGGTLPVTGSPWYNLLALAAGMVVLGGLGFRTRKALR